MDIQKATQNKFVDKMMKIVPENPVSQAHYIYLLTFVVFFGLLGFSIASWVELFKVFTFTTMFRGLFMTAITVLSLFGLKQTRNVYLTTRKMFGVKGELKEEPKEESVDEMMEGFKK